MKKDKGFHEYVMNEVFQDFPDIYSRSMFGGWGIYKGGLFFALISDGQLFFKVNETNKKAFTEKGSKQFTYNMHNGKTTRLNFWELPADLYEDKLELGRWVDKAVLTALKAKKK